MIIEGLLSIINLLLSFVFGLLPNLPSFPEDLSNSINYILDVIFNNAGLLGLFIHINTLKIILFYVGSITISSSALL